MARKDKRAITRDENGLMEVQREFLLKYAETGSEKEVRETLELTTDRVNHWMRTDDAFKTAYAEAVEGIHEAVVLKLKAQEEKLPEAIAELMDAEKSKKVTCPECEHKFQVTVIDTTTRARMVTMLMKSQDHLKEVHRVEGEISVGITEIPFALQIALSMHNKGKQISEASRRELVQQDLIPDEPQIVIEGESKRLEGGADEHRQHRG